MLGNAIMSAYIKLPFLLILDHQSLYSSPAVEPCPAPNQVSRNFAASFCGEQEQTHTIPISVRTISDSSSS